MSAWRQRTLRAPMRTGRGYMPAAMPLYQVDLETWRSARV